MANIKRSDRSARASETLSARFFINLQRLMVTIMKITRGDLIKASIELQRMTGVHIYLGGSIYELHRSLKETLVSVNLESVDFSEETKDTFRRIILE